MLSGPHTAQSGFRALGLPSALQWGSLPLPLHLLSQEMGVGSQGEPSPLPSRQRHWWGGHPWLGVLTGYSFAQLAL